MRRVRIVLIVVTVSLLGVGCDTLLPALGNGERWVTVTGRVDEIHEYDEFMLDDGNARIEVFVRGGHEPSWFETGDSVTVEGWLEETLFRRELYASEIVLPDGSVVTVAGGDAWE